MPADPVSDLIAAARHAAAWLRLYCADVLGHPAEETVFAHVIGELEKAARGLLPPDSRKEE